MFTVYQDQENKIGLFQTAGEATKFIKDLAIKTDISTNAHMELDIRNKYGAIVSTYNVADIQLAAERA